MATITFKGLEEYERRLSNLGKKADEIAGKAVYAGAAIVADEVRRRLKRNLDDPEYLGYKTDNTSKNEHSKNGKHKGNSGGLYDSLGISSMQTKDGYINVKIGFDGYDSNGVPNQLKARVMESGTSKQKKRPFVRPALYASQSRAVAKMSEVIDEEIEKIMK